MEYIQKWKEWCDTVTPEEWREITRRRRYNPLTDKEDIPCKSSCPVSYWKSLGVCCQDSNWRYNQLYVH